ncbi:hypothetical protein, partial [Roseateles sp.]|uniref:hypothetical protein n=1 Tax=Roseateles sp. TaxID=1971397 RepID=UPI003BA779E0
TGFLDEASFAGLQFAELLTHLNSPEMKMPPDTSRCGGSDGMKQVTTFGSYSDLGQLDGAAPGLG